MLSQSCDAQAKFAVNRVKYFVTNNNDGSVRLWHGWSAVHLYGNLSSQEISIHANDFSKNWKVLFFDILIYAFAGGFVSAYVTTSLTIKEAVLTGMAWNALIAGLIQSEVSDVLANLHDSVR